MGFVLSKTDYILYRECAKNAWLKVHRPDIYLSYELSEFEKQIIETGNEVDKLAREIFPTAKFQERFEAGGFLAITDIVIENERGIELYEVKATNDVDDKVHIYDLAFQANVIELSLKKLHSMNLVHLNSEYVRFGELELDKLFKKENLTEKIRSLMPEVLEDMKLAQDYLSKEDEPKGPCSCVYKGRSGHCTTFHYSNPHIPDYSIHDLARIGLSKRKLAELVDSNIFHIHEVPEGLELFDIQKNQIWTHVADRPITVKEKIAEELESLIFPLYFLDYETFPAAIPRYNGFSPYNQIPFQYSLHVLHSPDAEPEHKDFIFTDAADPSEHFLKSLQEHIGPKGHVVVWHKGFECSRNKEIATRLPHGKAFMDDLETRIYDLEDIFKKQYHVHKDFRGSSSIKKVSPVMAPELSYKELPIHEGASAANAWNQIAYGSLTEEEKKQMTENLRVYCKLDTYAMYAIWKALYKMVF